MTLLAAGQASAQDPPQGGNPPAQAAPAPPDRPGFLDAIGRWFEGSFSGFNTGIKDAQDRLGAIGQRTGEAAKDAAGVAKDTADTIARLPAARVVDARRRCELAANGAPDCAAAAVVICRGKGFSTGQSIDIESAKKCPARVWLSARRAAEDCTVETFVVRAMCQ